MSDGLTDEGYDESEVLDARDIAYWQDGDQAQQGVILALVDVDGVAWGLVLPDDERSSDAPNLIAGRVDDAEGRSVLRPVDPARLPAAFEEALRHLWTPAAVEA